MNLGLGGTELVETLAKVRTQARAAAFVNQYFRSHMLPSMLEALAWNFWRYRSIARPGALDDYLPNFPTVRYSPVLASSTD